MVDYQPLIEHLIRAKRYPVLFFLFSRAGVENGARLTAAALNLLSEEDSQYVKNHVEKLSQRVRNLHQTLCRCLPCGIGFHHAGLLPSAKHVVEELFEKGYLPVVFCTETFALGVNFPAKTVVFGSTTKRDDFDFRPLTNREILQISGRAGRRGMDRLGYAYVLVDPDHPDEVFLSPPDKAEQVAARAEMTSHTTLRLIDRFGDNEEDVKKYLDFSFAVYKNRAYCTRLLGRINAAKKKVEDFTVDCGPLSDAENLVCPVVWYGAKRKIARLTRDVEFSHKLLEGPYRKKKKKKNRHVQLIKGNKKLIEELENSLMEKAGPLTCSQYRQVAGGNKCPVYKRKEEASSQLSGLEKELLNFPYSVETLFNQFRQIKELLAGAGFIEHGRLTEKGITALSAGPAGILLAEILDAIKNDEMSESKLAGIVAGCLCERLDNHRLKSRVWHEAREARKRLLDAGFTEDSVLFNENDAQAVSNFARFGDIALAAAEGNMAPGDLVVLCRRVAEVLRGVALKTARLRETLHTAHEIIWQEEVAEVMPVVQGELLQTSSPVSLP